MNEIKIGDKIRLSITVINIKGHSFNVEDAYKQQLINYDRYSELQPYMGYVLDIDQDNVLLNTGNGQIWVNYKIRNVEHIK